MGNAKETTGNAPVIICDNCEREVPAGSVHCPHCCGADGQRGALRRGAFTGGILGLMAGGVGAAVFLAIFGPEYNTWSTVSGIVLGCALIGAVLGMRASRNE